MLPNTKIEASFFSEKNSREEASSKGWISFFLENFLASGDGAGRDRKWHLALFETGSTTKEEGYFGVFNCFRGFFVEGSFGAGVAGFSRFQLALRKQIHEEGRYLHLPQHLACNVVDLKD